TAHLLNVRYTHGRGELARLECADVVETFEGLLRVEPGLRAGEALALVRAMLEPGRDEPELFDALIAYLGAECTAKDAGELAAFLLHALALHGVSPELTACGACGKRAPEHRSACFDPQRGTLVCRDCGGAGQHLAAETRAAA